MPVAGHTLLLLLVSVGLLAVPASAGAGMHTWERFTRPASPREQALPQDTFPQGFAWAVGTAAYPVEGAWESDGKGPSVWDTFTKAGDVGCDSYGRVQADVRAIRQLGVTHYRFSLSWSRLFPNGTLDSYNPAGATYYHTLLRELRRARVEPIITLYHWDLPNALQKHFGGWRDPRLVEIFRDYADFCFATFGDGVHTWITMDNPFVVAWHGYGTGMMAPGVKDDLDLPFIVAHNLLKAHAAAWHLYDQRYRRRQGGRVSIALGSHWIRPSRMRRENIQACQCSLEFVLGWFAGPLFAGGEYPPCMRRMLSSRLPKFTAAERSFINGTVDFFALSHGPSLSFQLDSDLLRFGQTEDLDLRMLLYWVREEYHNPPVFIVESGWFVSGNSKTEDPKHMYYLKWFIAETLKSIKYDKVRVLGYTAWSLVDGYEWQRAYSIRRGLFHVDFTSPHLKREPKTSAVFYRTLIEKNGFPPLPENTHMSGRFPCGFAWGVATNSIQVEKTPSQFADTSVYLWNITGNGELKQLEGAGLPYTRVVPHCSDYTSVRRQVSQARRLHISHFHFFLNWSAVVPTGDVSEADTTLLAYYACFASELRRAGLVPVVTLWHAGLPPTLKGWWSNQTVQAFAEYARLCYQHMGAHVKMWITLNEPNLEKLSYEAAHNMLRAHGLAWRIYDREFRQAQGGKVSLTLLMDWVEPAYTLSQRDLEPAARVLDFRVGWFAEPIFGSDGDYPSSMRRWLQQRSGMDLLSHQLPTFSAEDRQLVSGSYDFFALSHFTTTAVADVREDRYLYESLLDVQYMADITWLKSPKNTPVVPWGLRKALNWVASRYKDVPIYIMANGVDEDRATFQDNLRVYYLHNYINEALKAHQLDGVNLQGYFFYALSDQWDPGFGLFGYVNEESVAKSSLGYYNNVVQHNGFPEGSWPTQHCAPPPGPCASCSVLSRRPVQGFLSLVGSALLLTVGILIYFSARRQR